jgi:hypothetical protein
VATSVPDLTGTWWKSKRDGHRIQVLGRVGTDRFVAHRERRDGWTHTYSVSLYVLQASYRQVAAPRRKKSPALTESAGDSA